MNLISISLWGSHPMYVRGAEENIRLAPIVYPGWTLRLYVDRSAHELLRRDMGEPACEVMVMPDNAGIFGMSWRFLAVSDPDAEYVIVRDADSRLNLREKAAVDAWMASGKRAHVMRDHPHHARWPMLGGMFGLRGGVIPDMPQRIAQWRTWAVNEDDQHFLAERIWPEIQGDCLQHCSTPNAFGGEPFPPHPPSLGRYVGHVFDADGNPDPTR